MSFPQCQDLDITASLSPAKMRELDGLQSGKGDLAGPPVSKCAPLSSGLQAGSVSVQLDFLPNTDFYDERPRSARIE
jgi:hypothetical protein